MMDSRRTQLLVTRLPSICEVLLHTSGKPITQELAPVTSPKLGFWSISQNRQPSAVGLWQMLPRAWEPGTIAAEKA
jgi:hypothetical protein